MPRYQDIASKTIMGSIPHGKKVFAIKTEKSPHKYAAELIKHQDAHYHLNLTVHGRSGKNQRDGTLNDIAEFIKEVKNKFTPDEWNAISEITFGGDVNFATVTNQVAEAGMVIENREKLHYVLSTEFSMGYDISVCYPTEVTTQKRAEKSSQNSQYFKNGATDESTTDVMVGVLITKNQTPTEKSPPIQIIQGQNPVAMHSKTYQAATSCPGAGDLKSCLDHSMVFIQSQNNLNVYVNIIPARGWNGLQAPKPGINSAVIENQYEALQLRMEDEWLKMKAKLTPEDSRTIKEWQYLFSKPVTQEQLDKCRTGIRSCIEAIFLSTEYQIIAQQLFHAIPPQNEEEKNDHGKEFILPTETEKEKTGAWRKLGIYLSGQSEEMLHQLIDRYMYNMNTSMSRLEGDMQHNPEMYKEYKSFTFNNIANDIFTALGQQMLGGYPVPEDIASRARAAASSLNPKEEIDAICNEMEDAQLAQIEQAIRQYLWDNQVPESMEIVVHAVEIGDNQRFNAEITPHPQLPKNWIGQDLAQRRGINIKLGLNAIKNEDSIPKAEISLRPLVL
ncbi:hypothetical protein Lsai_0397 [Legionella sainthelensi]|uniref:Uncharacterized protein n=1 Tax=Legionella sainthelensi TaxID=28087 RepID=A0A0W0YS86_9GAMM|nr:hypothetical protein [Legionella sainthelensi]KTD59753.1 hypothetical protein Lsai_0397 [Legionella sainthelensi]VEH31658.1 Uncharacterised protein [Legionella sainthelensi]